MHYTKKPVTVEAITFDELVAHGIEVYAEMNWPLNNGAPWSFRYQGHEITHENDDCYLIPTPEGTMKFNRGDMLVTGIEGEIYPVKMSVFEESYEPAYGDGPAGFLSPDLIAVEQERQTFEQELVSLINRHSIENRSNTPDWILGEYLIGCMKAFELTMHLREEYYGRPSPITAPKPPKEVNALATPEEQPYDPLKEFERMKRGEALEETDKSVPDMRRLADTVSVNPSEAARLLLEHARKFRFYEGQHNGKIDRMALDDEAREATISKAIVNAGLAQEIEQFLGIDPAIPQADGA